MRAPTFFDDGPAFHPYEWVRDDPELAEMKANIDELWRLYDGLEDDHFRIEAKKDHDSCQRRFWEMYVGASLRDAGHEVISVGAKGPDCTVLGGEQRVHVECVAPDAGSGPDKLQPLPKVGFVDANEGPDLRLLSGILDKRRKFETYRAAGLVGENEPCIIAINGALVPAATLGQFQLPRIVRLAYGLGQLEYVITIGGERNDDEPESRFPHRPEVKKRKGATVGSAVLMDPASNHVSALLWAGVDWKAVGQVRPFGTTFVLVHNPEAANPLPRGWLTRGREYWVAEDGTLAHADHRPAEDA